MGMDQENHVLNWRQTEIGLEMTNLPIQSHPSVEEVACDTVGRMMMASRIVIDQPTTLIRREKQCDNLFSRSDRLRRATESDMVDNLGWSLAAILFTWIVNTIIKNG